MGLTVSRQTNRCHAALRCAALRSVRTVGTLWHTVAMRWSGLARAPAIVHETAEAEQIGDVSYALPLHSKYAITSLTAGS